MKPYIRCIVTLPIQTVVDFRFVLMVMFHIFYKDTKEFQASLHFTLVDSANSKSLDSKKSQAPKSDNNRAIASTCAMCGRFYYERNKCLEVENKYANKTNSVSIYIGSATHALLVKDTGHKGFIPNSCQDKRNISSTLPESNGAPSKKPFEKKDWKEKRA